MEQLVSDSDERRLLRESARSGRWRALTHTAVLGARRLAFGSIVLLAIIFLSYLGLSMARGAAMLVP